MDIIIWNKNKYINRLKSSIRQYIYNTYFMWNNYLKFKNVIIKNSGMVNNAEGVLFKKIFIETISYCNNDCSFCPASAKIGVKNPENFMTEDLYIKIIRELRNISFNGSIAFHCNNEPFLDDRLTSWIKTARRFLKNNFIYLYTNGILINTELADRIFEAGLNRIIINNYNDKNELNHSVKKLLDGSFNSRGEIIINYRFKSEYFGNRAGQSPNARFLLKEPLKIICLRPLTEIVVGYDGTVPLCCADGLWKVIMGNAQKSSLKEIWFSGFYKRIRECLVKGDRSCTEICKVCDALNFPAIKGVR